jgi:hypothetical protein
MALKICHGLYLNVAQKTRAPSANWIGGWVDPRAGLDEIENRKILPLSGLILNPSAVQPVASRYTDRTIPAPVSSKTIISTFF